MLSSTLSPIDILKRMLTLLNSEGLIPIDQASLFYILRVADSSSPMLSELSSSTATSTSDALSSSKKRPRSEYEDGFKEPIQEVQHPGIHAEGCPFSMVF